MRTKNKRIYGWGINDAPFCVYVDGKPIKEYTSWVEMIRRGNCEKFKNKYPVYADCIVCDEWKTFYNFYQWYQEQLPPSGWNLDKDLLFRGNRLYSPETAVFIEKSLNAFMTESDKGRGEYPIGVHEKRGRFIAQCRNVETNKETHIGVYMTPEEAHNSYREYKWNQAKVWVERVANTPHYRRQDDIIEALRKRYYFSKSD